MKTISQVTSVCLLGAAFVSGCNSSSSSSSNAVNKPDNSNTTTQQLPAGFTKSTSVFGVSIWGTDGTPDDKMLHAANVMAEYLDSNEDGVPDNQAVVDQMVSAKATLIMPANESDAEKLSDSLPESDAFQDLYASEVFLNGIANGDFDASLEEVLHLITHTGYAQVYPNVFGEKTGTSISDAMDIARGGQFTSIPSSYPDSAWYTYNDETCDYSCMVTEYTYWALTSILGAQNSEGRLEGIQHEWKLNTRDKVQQQDVAAYTLLTDSQYALPSELPDGKYAAKTFEITKGSGGNSNNGDNTDSTSGANPDHEILQAVSRANPGYKIAFTDETQIYMMNPDGSGKEALADGSPIAGYVAWSSDGYHVYFASAKGREEAAWEAFRVDVNTQELTQLTQFSQDVRSLSVSPDNQYLAISVMSGNSNIGDNNDNLTQFHTDLYIMNMTDAEAKWAAGEKLALSDMNALVSSPAADQFWYEELNWNPINPTDGGEPVLAYTKTWRYDEDDVSYTHVYTIRADGSDQQLILENKDQPIWDSKGEKLCFLDMSCYLLADESSSNISVNNVVGEKATANISPDGGFVLFEAGDDPRRGGMARLNEDGSADGVIIGSHTVMEPRWSPAPVQ